MGQAFLEESVFIIRHRREEERKSRIKKGGKIPSGRRKLTLVIHDLAGKNASEREYRRVLNWSQKKFTNISLNCNLESSIKDKKCNK